MVRPRGASRPARFALREEPSPPALAGTARSPPGKPAGAPRTDRIRMRIHQRTHGSRPPPQDRRTVLTHPRGHVHIWLADASTLAVLPKPRAEVLARLAPEPEPYLWAPVDAGLTQRVRAAAGRDASLLEDGCLSGLQLNALRPRGAALLGGAFLSAGAAAEGGGRPALPSRRVRQGTLAARR
eukprot:gene11503-2668_t